VVGGVGWHDHMRPPPPPPPPPPSPAGPTSPPFLWSSHLGRLVSAKTVYAREDVRALCENVYAAVVDCYSDVEAQVRAHAAASCGMR
jgi:hypothetical protein